MEEKVIKITVTISADQKTVALVLTCDKMLELSDVQYALEEYVLDTEQDYNEDLN